MVIQSVQQQTMTVASRNLCQSRQPMQKLNDALNVAATLDDTVNQLDHHVHRSPHSQTRDDVCHLQI